MKPWRVPYPKFGAGPGLERVARIADALGLELAAFGASAAVIVGSNGKGSTAAMTAALLRSSGADVGLFTSPHLFDLNERFRIDDDDISDEALAHHWTRVATAAERGLGGRINELGGFEFLFLIAADWFAAQHCAFTVWEAGIGGRMDPARLIEAWRIALTSLDLEHTELLGDTLEEIASDKLDAAPKGSVAFIGASCAPKLAAIAAHATSRGVKFALVDALAEAPLAGRHQCENAALAKALAEDMLGERLSDASLAEGFATTRWPGRLEVIGRDPLMVVDVGHTPAAAQAALHGFNELTPADAKRVLVCGASQDKRIDAIVGPLAAAFPTIVCVSARHKGAPAHEIARHAIEANPAAEIIIAESMRDAHAIALGRAHAAGAVLAAGGLFLAAEFKGVHLGRDPGALAFF